MPPLSHSLSLTHTHPANPRYRLACRLPTFSRAADVETFIKPGPQVVEGSMLGGAPFFT